MIAIPCFASCRRLLSAAALLTFVPTAACAGVEFPGPPPGPAESAVEDGFLTLENAVIAAGWKVEGGTLRPVVLANRLNRLNLSSLDRIDQTSTELFRLATKPVGKPAEGVCVGLRLESDRVVAVASRDGNAWTELASYPRAEFPGEPKLVRIGKMDLKAQARDHNDPGPVGEGVISQIAPLPPQVPGGRFDFKTGAHQTATTEFAFPQGTKFVSCRIDKGTDQGMSWAPALALVWEDGKRFVLIGLREKNPTFNLTTAAGERTKSMELAVYPTFDLAASAFQLVSPPRVGKLAPLATGVRVAERIGGVAIDAELVAKSGIRARWHAELRDGSNYLRQTLSLTSARPVPIYGLEFADLRMEKPRIIGTVPGCPVAGGGLFAGVEIPGSKALVADDSVRIGFGCQLELTAAQPYQFGSVTGVAPEGQLSRSFLAYIERERARPSKPFLHYNCWYDLGFGVDEPSMLEVMKAFDTELVKKRGVPVLAYLVDDGWDNPGKGLWIENTDRFPAGFRGLNDKMKPYNTHPAVWISPLGGYGGAKERTEWARQQGLIPAGGELDLSHPKYKQWFQDRCLQLMREAGVNAFKWDRAGEGVSPHFMALLDVARNLRQQNPELFVNVTVGTWPSPFWLNHVDCTWRNGSGDVGWSGKGDDRERWLTFRDGSCRQLFAEASPLYPLNSAMHHGIVHGRCFQGEKVGKAGSDLKNEARSYFANGASLQELYLTPSMMTADAWDRVAEAAKWAHANAEVLVDAHWVGGDPLKLEPYGYAAWSPRKGTLMVRNPDELSCQMTLDAAAVFELPAGAAQTYALRSPYQDQRVPTLKLTAGTPTTITLEPFEVLVFDATPE